MAIWSVPTNKQQTSIVAGPASSQTLTLGTPAAGSVLICLVTWTGAQTVTVSGGTGNSWLSKPQIDNGSNHCQIWYVLSAAHVATTVLATFTGNVTNIQLFDAEYPVSQTQGVVVAVDTDIHTATGTSTAPSSGALSATYSGELWIGYADAGTSLTWSAAGGSPYTLRSTAATSRGAYEDVINAPNSVVGTAAFAITSNPWAAGAILFSVTSVGTGYVIPAAESVVGQGQLVAAPASRFSINTDPMGGGNSGSGTGVGQIYPTGRA